MRDSQPTETDPGRTFIHEVTNAITIVMGQCFLLQLDETISPAVRARLDAIAIATERIAKLIHEYPTRRSEGHDPTQTWTKQRLTGSS
ncbi:MAG: hypothetical protein ACXVZJ_13885 [Terriglobales bacterium]